jgi:colicin import membrane protein
MGAALVHDKLLPRPPGGIAPGAALAVVVHAGLIAALTLGVDWRTHSPEVVSAELWAAVPQSAAPPPPPVVEPPAPTPAPVPAPAPPPVARTEPPPPPPDIALERERKKAEAERKKAEQEAELKAERQRDADKKKADDERKKREQAEERRAADKRAAEKAEDERLDKQREENLRRMMGQAGATPGAAGTTGSAAQNAAPSATYAGKVKAAVRPNIVFTGMAEFNAAAEVEVSSAPGGSIISRRLIKSSGYKDWDEAVLRAIDKTRNLPRDTDGRVPALLIISFRPNE